MKNSDLIFGSKQHIKNLISTLEIYMHDNIGRKWDAFKWDHGMRICGMAESVLWDAMPDKFGPGKPLRQ